MYREVLEDPENGEDGLTFSIEGSRIHAIGYFSVVSDSYHRFELFETMSSFSLWAQDDIHDWGPSAPPIVHHHLDHRSESSAVSSAQYAEVEEIEPDGWRAILFPEENGNLVAEIRPERLQFNLIPELTESGGRARIEVEFRSPQRANEQAQYLDDEINHLGSAFSTAVEGSALVLHVDEPSAHREEIESLLRVIQQIQFVHLIPGDTLMQPGLQWSSGQEVQEFLELLMNPDEPQVQTVVAGPTQNISQIQIPPHLLNWASPPIHPGASAQSSSLGPSL